MAGALGNAIAEGFTVNAVRRVGKLDSVDLPDARDMPSPLELGGEPDPDDPDGLVLRDGPLSDRKAVGVVVGPVPDRDLLAPAHAAAHAPHAVGRFSGSGLRAGGKDGSRRGCHRRAQRWITRVGGIG